MAMQDYDCAICQRRVETRWFQRDGPYKPRRPVCEYCEREYGRRAEAGAFADRRTVSVGSALAEALACEAARAMWPPEWRA